MDDEYIKSLEDPSDVLYNPELARLLRWEARLREPIRTEGLVSEAIGEGADVLGIEQTAGDREYSWGTGGTVTYRDPQTGAEETFITSDPRGRRRFLSTALITRKQSLMGSNIDRMSPRKMRTASGVLKISNRDDVLSVNPSIEAT